eukprot:4220365-Pleurochrysis_carterae.AAC.2
MVRQTLRTRKPWLERIRTMHHPHQLRLAVSRLEQQAVRCVVGSRGVRLRRILHGPDPPRVFTILQILHPQLIGVLERRDVVRGHNRTHRCHISLVRFSVLLVYDGAGKPLAACRAPIHAPKTRQSVKQSSKMAKKESQTVPVENARAAVIVPNEGNAGFTRGSDAAGALRGRAAVTVDGWRVGAGFRELAPAWLGAHLRAAGADCSVDARSALAS